MDFPPPVQPTGSPDPERVPAAAAGAHGPRLTRTFSANGIQLSNLPGTVHVRVAPEATIRLNINGPPLVLPRVISQVLDGILTVTAPVDLTTTELTTALDVPVGTSALIFASRAGDYHVGDISAEFLLILGGTAAVTAGKVGPCNLSVQQNATADIAEVTGATLNANLHGNSSLVIRAGSVDYAWLSAEGACNAAYDGSATHAELTALDASDIYVDRVRSRLRIQPAGQSTIRVRAHPREVLPIPDYA
jgi:hypothetical protein